MQDTSTGAQGARSRATLVVGIVLAFGTGILVGYLIGVGTPAARAEIPQTVHRVEIGDAPTLGPDTAPVTVVLFTDFRCPFCRKAAKEVRPLRDRFGDDLRVVFKHFPMTQLHPRVKRAHRAAAAAAAQGRFWPYHDLLFAHTGRLDRDVLEDLAAEAGLDMDDFRAALDDEALAHVVEQDLKQGRALGVRGTPTFFVNGRMVVGMDERRLTRVIRYELDRTRELMEGLSSGNVYETIMKDATPPAGKQERAAQPPRPPRSASVERTPDDPEAVYRVGLQNSTVVGKPDAPVTMVVFFDYQCSFSAHASENIEKLSDRYGENLRLVFKNNPQPRHEHALLAAEAALAAGAQGKFKAMHDLLFENRRELDREAVEGFAKKLGLDMAAFARSLDENRFVPLIKQEQQLAIRLGATSTPTFFINGRKLEGDQPYETLVQNVDEAMKRARALLAKGVDAKNLYETIIADGITNVGVTTPPPRRRSKAVGDPDVPF
jgi:protein-disulfide isomerase